MKQSTNHHTLAESLDNQVQPTIFQFDFLGRQRHYLAEARYPKFGQNLIFLTDIYEGHARWADSGLWASCHRRCSFLCLGPIYGARPGACLQPLRLQVFQQLIANLDMFRAHGGAGLCWLATIPVTSIAPPLCWHYQGLSFNLQFFNFCLRPFSNTFPVWLFISTAISKQKCTLI